MYKILLADDEILSRTGMQKCIQEAGDYQVDVAADGRRAIELIRSRAYDAVILDIMMPEYDGLQVLEQIQDLRPAPVKIIISGYDRFDYAQKALRFGVNDYLIKPLAPEQIRQLLDRLADVIEQRQALIQSEKMVELELEKSRAVMRERFLETLCCGRTNHATLQEQMNYYDISFRWPLFAVALVSIDLAGQDTRFDEKQHLTFELTFLKSLRTYSGSELDILAFHTMGDRIGILFNYRDVGGVSRIEALLDELVQTFREYLNVQLVAGVGNTTDAVNALHQSFQEALMAYRWCIVSQSTAVKFYSDIYEASPEMAEGFEIELLVAKLSTGNIDDVIEKLDELLSQNGRGRARAFHVMTQLISACQVACQSSNAVCDRELLAQAFAVLCLDYSRVDGSSLDIFKKLLRSTCESIEKTRSEKSNFYIKKAKDLIERYIVENAGEITVGRLADELGLSKNYFGKIFKSSTGSSVSGYVNNLRIKRAAELLRTTNMKVYEVGYAVGFENQHYFSVAFKQNIGVSPSEFRELI